VYDHDQGIALNTGYSAATNLLLVQPLKVFKPQEGRLPLHLILSLSNFFSPNPLDFR